MHIGIDGNEANYERKVGVHQYAYEILWGLYRLNQSSKNNDTFTIYLRTEPKNELPRENKDWRYKVLVGGKVWILSRLMPHLLFREKVDVLFVPSHYTPPVTRNSIVFTIHDLGYLNSSEHFKKYDFWQLKYWTAISIYVSKGIIAVSKFTKKDIVRHYKSASVKTSVVPHGYVHRRFNTKISESNVRRVKSKYFIQGKYVLFLSTLKPSKNIDGILRSFKVLKDSDSTYGVKLVIAGKKGWLYESIFALVEDLGLQSDVIFTDYVNEKEKPALIYGARVFVSPSHWEGFGMQVLESLACGTPVVVSNVASLPEVAGEAGVYVDNKDPEDIARGIKRVLSMKTRVYNELVSKGLVQASKFSWERSARETLKVIKETAV